MDEDKRKILKDANVAVRKGLAELIECEKKIAEQKTNLEEMRKNIMLLSSSLNDMERDASFHRNLLLELGIAVSNELDSG